MNREILKRILDYICHDDERKEEALKILLNMDEKYIGDYLINFVENRYICKLISKSDLQNIMSELRKLKFKEFKYQKKLKSKTDYIYEKYAKITDLKKNHNEINVLFDELNKFLNKNNIDYYHTGGILTYFLTNTPLNRFHHDMDVFINYKDLPKLENLIKDSNGKFQFIRDWGDRDDGKKSRFFKIKYNKSDIPITIIMFERQKKGGVIQKDYFLSGNNLCCENIYNSPECSKLSFEEEKQYKKNGIPYKTISLEALYCSKESLGREKDKKDCEIIRKHINQKKAKRLKEILKNQKANKTYIVDDKNIISFICKENEIERVI